MTHLELVTHVARQAEMDEKEVRRVLDTTFDAIIDEVSGGDKVVVGGFGTFKSGLKRRRPGADKSAPRATKLMLTPSSALSEKLNP